MVATGILYTNTPKFETQICPEGRRAVAKEVLQQYVVVWFWHTTGAYNGTLLSGKTKEKILPEDRTCALCMEMESARKMLAGTCTVLYKL